MSTRFLEQRAQLGLGAEGLHHGRRVDAEVDILAFRPRRIARHDFAQSAARFTAAKAWQRHAGIEAREIHELLHQPSRALDAARELVQRGGARGGALRALGQLHLEGERGHGRAKLVRGVGQKAPLRAEASSSRPSSALIWCTSGTSSRGTLSAGRRIEGVPRRGRSRGAK